MTLDTIRSDFAFLDDWEDRYPYVIEKPPSHAPLRTSFQPTRSSMEPNLARRMWEIHKSRFDDGRMIVERLPPVGSLEGSQYSSGWERRSATA